MRLLTISLVLLTLLSIIGLSWLLDHFYQSTAAQNQLDYRRELVLMARQLAARSNSANPIGQDASTVNLANQNAINISEIPLAQMALPAELITQLQQGQPLFLSSDNSWSLHLLKANKTDLLNIEFDKPIQQIEPFYQRLGLTLLFYIGIISIVVLWSTPLLHRLSTIRQAMIGFGRGQLTSRIKPSRLSYVKDIEIGFNQMASKVEELIEDNQFLTRAVSHDLRTPVARLRFGLDLLEESKLDDKQFQYIQHLNQDLDAMETLIETLLCFAKLEQNYIQLNRQWHNLTHLLEQQAYLFAHAAIRYVVEGKVDNIQIYVDASYFKMLLDNVLGNAKKFAQQAIIVRVSIVNVDSGQTKNVPQLQLTIEDDGVGIPEDLYQKVLTPFYRANQENKGHGMGLAIVARIAKWHQFSIQLDKSSQLGGLQFKLLIDSTSYRLLS